MSYQSDHMAWQQRVGQELHAYRKHFDKFVGSEYQGSSYASGFGLNSYEGRMTNSSDIKRQQIAMAGGKHQSQNKVTYAYGGKTKINKGNPVLSGAGQQYNYDGLHRDTLDIISQTGKNAYAAKSKVQAAKDRAKSAVLSQASQQSSTKVYYPTEYFQRSGYKFYQQQQDELRDDKPKQRFNEDYQRTQKEVQGRQKTKLTVDALQSQLQTRQQDVFSNAGSQVGSKLGSAYRIRKNIVPASKLKEENPYVNDGQSIITQEKLQQFNDIQKDQQVEKIDVNPNEGLEVVDDEENKDQVLEMVSVTKPQDKQQDLQSIRSGFSRASKTSSQYIISNLEDQLNRERVERQKLQDQVEEMKKINQEISSKLGLSTASQQKQE